MTNNIFSIKDARKNFEETRKVTNSKLLEKINKDIETASKSGKTYVQYEWEENAPDTPTSNEINELAKVFTDAGYAVSYGSKFSNHTVGMFMVGYDLTRYLNIHWK